MTYELPRTESGDVDFEAIYYGLADHTDDAWEDIMDYMKAIDANARAEEREKAAKLSDEFYRAQGKGHWYNELTAAIRALGDEG